LLGCLFVDVLLYGFSVVRRDFHFVTSMIVRMAFAMWLPEDEFDLVAIEILHGCVIAGACVMTIARFSARRSPSSESCRVALSYDLSAFRPESDVRRRDSFSAIAVRKEH
jgi:hypothetical protein